MNTEVLMGIVILAGTLLGLVGVSFLLGGWAAMYCLRIGGDRRTNLDLYKKWGLDQEVRAWLLLPGKFGGVYLFLVAPVIVGFAVSLVSVVELTEATRSIVVTWETYWKSGIFILFLILGPAVFGFTVRKKRLDDIEKKVSELESLKGGPFLPSRIVALISTYDALRVAPPIFWDAYVKSHNDNPNAKTDQRFRELIAPYYYSEPNQHTRLVFLVNLVALAIAAASLGITVGIILIRTAPVMD